MPKYITHSLNTGKTTHAVWRNNVYRISQEEMSIFREVIISVILTKKCICTYVLHKLLFNDHLTKLYIFFNDYGYMLTNFLYPILVRFSRCLKKEWVYFSMKIYIFWDINPYSPFKVKRIFGKTCYLHLHGGIIS
jgi:hypothetical protein